MRSFPVPNVLECMRFVAVSSTEHKRTVKNYEVDLYLDGDHKISLDGVSYTNTDRCLIFRKPGQYTTGIGNYNMYSLTLDLSGSVVDEQKLYRNASGYVQPLCDLADIDDIPSVFAPYHFEEIKELMEKLSRCSYPNVPDEEHQAQLVKELLFLILYDANKYNRMRKESASAINTHIRKACNYIADNFEREITLDDISNALYVNKNHLIKIFKKELGQTPNKYILEMRLIRARQLLLQTDQSVQDIAFSCGFNTPSYFSKKFKARFGALPLEVRQSAVADKNI